MAQPAKAIVTYPPQDGLVWKLEDVVVREPGDTEVQVRIIASGICHSDLVCSMTPPERTQYPIVLGHEGAGYITRVGSKITVAKVGDPVGLSFTSCLSCTQCKTGHPAFCNSFTALNIGGKKECFEGKEGKITGKFFGQSSFASYTVVDEYSVINLSGIIKNEEELKMFAPFGCGFQTGSGTVANLAGAGPEDTVTVMGLGGVGLSAVMVHEAAKLHGCRTIIAIDRVESRLQHATSLGATHTINTNDADPIQDLIQEVKGVTGGEGTSITIDTTGVPKLIEDGVQFTARRGQFFFIGIPPPTTMLPVDVRSMIGNGKRIQGSCEGDVVPAKYIPQMIKWYREGKFPVERLIKYYPADEFANALGDMHSGATVKPVLVW